MKCLLPVLFLLPLFASGAIEDLRIVWVNPGTDEVRIRNTAATTTTLSGAMAFCHRFDYSARIAAGTSFAAGEEKTFVVPGMDDSASDLWLYRGTGGFGSGANIVTGLQWGGPNDIGRTGLAKSAGRWADPAAVVPPPGIPLAFAGADAAAMPQSGSQWQIDAPVPPATPTLDPNTVLGLICVADGFQSPLGLKQAPGDDRIFIYDQNGGISILREGAVLPTPFVDLMPRLSGVGGGYSERGLLGLALHPDFPRDGRIYTYTSEPSAGTADFPLVGRAANHHSVVTEWQASAANPDVVDLATRREILRIEQPFSNHNGGDIAFGPDGMLYIALGDGGGGGDPLSAGQDLTTVLGKILRIDPFGTTANGNYAIPADNPFLGRLGVLPEIYAFGFRNPYRMDFDRLTGELYTGDVGQREIEEVDIVVAGGNYGWPIKEGSLFFNQSSAAVATTPFPGIAVPPGMIDPIAEYDHDEGISVIGGYVARGGARSDLEGLYVFGEYNGRIFILRDGGITEPTIGLDDRDVGQLIKGFGQDAAGDIYALVSNSGTPVGNGKVLKITPLAHIDEIEMDETDVTLEITIDASLNNPKLEETAVLLPSNTVWTTSAASLNDLGNGKFQATFPHPAQDRRIYRVTE